MKPCKPKGQSWPEDEPTDKTDIIFEFLTWLRQQGCGLNLEGYAQQFKEQYQE